MKHEVRESHKQQHPYCALINYIIKQYEPCLVVVNGVLAFSATKQNNEDDKMFKSNDSQGFPHYPDIIKYNQDHTYCSYFSERHILPSNYQSALPFQNIPLLTYHTTTIYAI